MLAIKLKPVGRKGQITYRVVVAEKRSKLKGKYIEDLGWVNPRESRFQIDKERAQYWVEEGGAQPTSSVHNLLVRIGVIEGKKIPVHSKKKISEEDLQETEADPEAAPEGGDKADESGNAEEDSSVEDNNESETDEEEKASEDTEEQTEEGTDESSEETEEVSEEESENVEDEDDSEEESEEGEENEEEKKEE